MPPCVPPTPRIAERIIALRGAYDMAMEQMRTVLSREQGELRLALAEAQRKSTEQIGAQFETTRAMIEAKLREMREGNEAKLAEIQKTVNEQLHAAVEKQMNESFNRVIDQFAAVQKAMGDVQAVTAQIGDIKRLFANVKTRGGWGETQVRAMLDDILPPGAYETNRKVRPDSDEAVEFVVIMPMRGEDRPLLPIDAKFPVEDYERLLAASEAGDAEGERIATRRLERAVREQARKIAAKYINPPVTVEFAVMYLPTDALYAEVARIPGLIDEIGRECRVLVLGPCLFPGVAAHDPSRVRYARAGAEGGPDSGPAGGDEAGDAQYGRGTGHARPAGRQLQQHDRAGPQCAPRQIGRKLRGVEAVDARAGGDVAGIGQRDAGGGCRRASDAAFSRFAG